MARVADSASRERWKLPLGPLARPACSTCAQQSALHVDPASGTRGGAAWAHTMAAAELAGVAQAHGAQSPFSPKTSQTPSHTMHANASPCASPEMHAQDTMESVSEKMVCRACGEPIDEANAEDGAVRMSECFWHISCFTCITCGRQVPLDQDNVLLVGTQPMCGECTFKCCVCDEVIVHEVIMCDQDPYHTHCFRCSYCERPIESNVFAKLPGTLACVRCQHRIEEPTPPGSVRPPSQASESGTDSTQSGESARPTSLDELSLNVSPRYRESRLPDLERLSVEDPSWRRTSATTESSSFEFAYDRLSEMLQMEIVQAYYGMHSRAETPLHGPDEASRRSPSGTGRHSKGSLSALRKQLAQRASNGPDFEAQAPDWRDPWHRPGSYTDSEILRSLSMYDSEFEALLATPDYVRRSSGWSERPERAASRASMEVVDQIAQEIARARDEDTLVPERGDASTPASPRGASPQDGPDQVGNDAHSSPSRTSPASSHDPDVWQMKRRIALAELLAIKDARSPPGANEGEQTSIRSRVELVLHSLMAHLDSVKQEYEQEIQELVAEHQLLRQEMRPMRQLRTALHQENQRLAARADELHARVAALEARSLQASAQKPLPEEVEAARDPPLVPASSRSTHPAPPTPTHSRQPSGQSRLDASLPPLPEPRKFRWAKPRLLSSQDLSVLGETLLQPAYDVKRSTVARLSPPVPPKHASSAAAPEVAHVHQHVFQAVSMLRPSARCLVCSRNVWGQQELRCTLCSQACHHACLAHLTTPCAAAPRAPTSTSPHPGHTRTPSMPSYSMVGRALEEQVQREGQPVPRLIDWCVTAIEQNGLDDEGLYRKSGGSQQQRMIVQLFDSGQPFDLCDVRQFNDIGAITSVLKHYLRELPEPLIPRKAHEQFVEFGEQLPTAPSATALSRMRHLLETLPDAHRATLQRLCLHLKRVDQHLAGTRMSSRNLGLVFGPTLMRASDPARELLETSIYARTVECRCLQPLTQS